MKTPDFCHCGSNSSFFECCSAIFSGARSAETAEQLMRSRYSAFVVGNADYLNASWHPDTRPKVLSLEDDRNWLGLAIKRTEQGQATDDSGIVEFVARYKVAGRAVRLHEISRFVRESGQWYYVDGDHQVR